MSRGKCIVMWVVVAAFVFSFVRVSWAEGKTGFVDLTRLFDEYAKTKQYDKILDGKQKEKEAQREKMVEAIKKLQDNLMLLKENEKAAKQKELEDQMQKLEDFDRTAQTELKKERDDRIKEILKDIEDTVRKFAAQNGYAVILNDRVLLYGSQDLDVTNAILVILNGSKAESKAAPKAEKK